MADGIKGLTIWLGAVAASLHILPFATYAQEVKPARIGVLRISEPPPHYLEQFRAGMRELGHVEGQTYKLFPAWDVASRDRKKLRARAKKLVVDGVDIILGEGSPIARAALAATSSIPIVMAAAGSISRFVKSPGRPGGNITGLDSGSSLLAAKSFQILKEMIPGFEHGGSLHRAGTSGGSFVKLAKRAGDRMGFKFTRLNLDKGMNYAAIFDHARTAGIDAIYVRATTFLTHDQQKRLVAAARAAKIPTMYSTAHMVQMGGLISFGVLRATLWRRAATYVDQILKGAKPADLPVERPDKFELVINLTTAKALGIKVPRSLRLRADKVIR